MGSIVINGARIATQRMVGAGSVVTEGKEFAERSLIIGSPAAWSAIDAEQVTAMGSAAKFYAIENGPRFDAGLKKIG